MVMNLQSCRILRIKPAGLIFLSLFVLWPSLLFPQRYFTRTYGVVQGLLSSVINSVEQDSSGNIWCASNKGISRFDGVTWTTYNNIIGQAGVGFPFIRCDENGDIWTISHFNRLNINVFRNGKWETYLSEVNSNIDNVFRGFDVYHEEGRTIIVAATSTQGVFIHKDGFWRHFPLRREIPGTKILNAILYNKTVYIATDLGVSRLSGNQVDRMPKLNARLPPGGLYAIGKDESRRYAPGKEVLWLMGKGWVGYAVGDQFHLVRDKIKMSTDEYHGMIYAADNEIYFGTLRQLFRITLPKTEPLHIGRFQGLIGEGASDILVDRERNTWISGVRGLTFIPFAKFINYNESNGLADNEVSSGLEISPGRYVFGHDGALTFFDGNTFEIFRFRNKDIMKIHESRVQDLYLDRELNIWVASSQAGLARVTPSRKIIWYNHLFPRGEQFISVAGANDGTILVGCLTGLYRLDGEKVTRVIRDTTSMWSIRKVFPDEKGNRIFVATYNKGLLEISGNNFIQHFNSEIPTSNNVFGFLHDSKNNFWVGTADGLYILQGNRYQRDQKVGLPPERLVYLILEDHRGNLWFGTDDGVFRWDHKKLVHFNARDGFSGPDVNRDAGFVDSQNNIWFGTNQGITRIHPDFDRVLDGIPPPEINFDSLVTSEGKQPLDGDISLPYDQNTLEFYFSSISFLDQKRHKIICMLEPYDNKWSEELDATTRSYRYHNLPPGKYRFHLKAKNSLGTWSDVAISPVIQIHYPYYLQWWFIVLVVIPLILVGFLIFKYKISQRYNRALEETVAARTHQLKESERLLMQSNQSKDRFFSIIAHDLRSPFNVILGYIDLLVDPDFQFSPLERKDIMEKLRTTAHRTLNLLDNLLSWAKTQKGDLQVETTCFDLTEVVQENLILAESAASAKKINLYNNMGVPWMVYADRNMIQTVVRNLISNAIKFTYTGGTIIIEARKGTNGEVEVSVKDTGCGIPLADQEKLFSIDDHLATRGTNKESGSGLGLILCREFIHLNNGKIWVESETGKGSVFYFTLRTYHHDGIKSIGEMIG